MSRFAIAEAAHAAPVPGTGRCPRLPMRSLTEAALAYLALVGAADGCRRASPGRQAPPSRSQRRSQAARTGPVRLTNTDFTIDGRDLIDRLAAAGALARQRFRGARLVAADAAAARTAGDRHAAAHDGRDHGGHRPGHRHGLRGPAEECRRLARDSRRRRPCHLVRHAPRFEREVLAAAAEQMDHVSAEKLLSGIGMPLLYRAVATVRGHDAALQPLPDAAGHHRARRRRRRRALPARWSTPSAPCSAAMRATSR